MRSAGNNPVARKLCYAWKTVLPPFEELPVLTTGREDLMPVRTDINQIDIMTRREIEARIAGPLIRAYAEEIGEERALAIARMVITRLAREQGAQLAWAI